MMKPRPSIGCQFELEEESSKEPNTTALTSTSAGASAKSVLMLSFAQQFLLVNAEQGVRTTLLVPAILGVDVCVLERCSDSSFMVQHYSLHQGVPVVRRLGIVPTRCSYCYSDNDSHHTWDAGKVGSNDDHDDHDSEED